MIWHTSSAKDVLNELKTDSQNGLSGAEVNSRLAKYGKNLPDKKRERTFKELFLSQLKDVPTVVLTVAAILYFIIALITPENSDISTSVAEPIIILLIVVINAVTGALQQTGAEAAVESLKFISPPSATVVRNGKTASVPATNIVPGDVILLSVGNYIPADARIIEADGLRCDESSLTGVSVDSVKFAGELEHDITSVADQKNMVFAGCSVTEGSGRAVVVGTGKFTEKAKLSAVYGKNKNSTALQKRLKELGGILGVFALTICALILVFGTVFGKEEGGIFSNFLNTLLPTVALAVAAIPEGLNTIVALVMAIGVKRMVKSDVVVRSLSAVETLGGTTVVCTDKTGLLTHNSMELTHIYCGGNLTALKSSEISAAEKNIIMMATMCCDASAERVGDRLVRQGDATEAAIVAAAEKYAGGDKRTIESMYPRLCEIPFDPTRRLMTSVNMIDSKPVAVVKGTPEEVMACCVLPDADKITAAYEQMAKTGLRVIAVAFKALESEPTNPTREEFETGLSFGGLLGIYDPPRRGAENAVELCKNAGIKVVMLTGDHPATAAAAALEMGIISSPEQIATGEQIEEMSDEELADCVENFGAFARISPDQKTRIINAFKACGEVVTFVGDGVNDAPAISSADTGCTVESAPDVVKGAADVVLTNNSFSAMSDAITESRGIFSNIRKAIRYLIACNLGEVLTLLFAIVIWRLVPLSAMHILWINMITSAIPAISVGAAMPNKANVQPISDKNGGDIFTKNSIARIALCGVLTAILTILAFSLGGREQNLALSQTMAFATLSLGQIFAMVSVRSNRLIVDFKSHRFSPIFLYTFFGSILLIGAVLLIAPVTEVFGLVSLTEYGKWGTVLGLSVIPMIVYEILKIPSAISKK